MRDGRVDGHGDRGPRRHHHYHDDLHYRHEHHRLDVDHPVDHHYPVDNDDGMVDVRAIDIGETGLSPSYIAPADDHIVWTGVEPGAYWGDVYDIVSHSNEEVTAGLPGNYYNPSADGSLIVFQGARAGGYDDIYLCDTGNGLVRQLTHNSDPGDYNDWDPRIDGDRVVWKKEMLGAGAKPGIYVLDMNTGATTRVLAGADYHTPDIWGDYVVAVKSAAAGTGSEIVLYNLATQQLKSIAPASKDNKHPRIDSGYVVWSSGTAPAPPADYWDTYQIELYNIRPARQSR